MESAIWLIYLRSQPNLYNLHPTPHPFQLSRPATSQRPAPWNDPQLTHSKQAPHHSSIQPYPQQAHPPTCSSTTRTTSTTYSTTWDLPLPPISLCCFSLTYNYIILSKFIKKLFLTEDTLSSPNTTLISCHRLLLYHTILFLISFYQYFEKHSLTLSPPKEWQQFVTRVWPALHRYLWLQDLS